MALTSSQLNEKLGKLKHFMVLEIETSTNFANLKIYLVE